MKMVIRDIYQLNRSDAFYLGPGDEASVNLRLEKAVPLPWTRICGEVRGSVMPVFGATVKLLDKDFNPLCHTETDSIGRFSLIANLASGAYQLVAVAEGYLTSEASWISLQPCCTAYVTIPLIPDQSAGIGTVYGMVRDEMNKALPGTYVCLFHDSDMTHPAAVTMSTPDGEYLIYGLTAGDYCIKAFKKGYVFPEKINLSLSPRQIACADIYLYIDVLAVAGTISGKVFYLGNTVPNALTALYRIDNNSYSLIQVQNSNSDGFYLFPNVPPGKYLIKAKLESGFTTIRANVDLE